MKASAPIPRDKRAFSFKARRSRRALSTCRVIDLVCAVPLTMVGLGLWIAVIVVAAGNGGVFQLLNRALICLDFGVLAGWCGLLVLFNQVVLTPTVVSSGGSLRVVHRCPRDAVVAIHIRQRKFGRAPRAVTFAVLRDGTSIPLTPLSTLLSRTGPSSKVSMSARPPLQWARQVH